MKTLNAVVISKDLYRVDVHGSLVQHGVDPMMTPNIEGRAVVLTDKAGLQAMYHEIGEVLAGRPAPTPKTVVVDDLNPEDLA